MNKKRFYIISSTLLLIGLFAGVVQYVGMFDALYAAAINPGHSWSQMEGNENSLIKTSNGKVLIADLQLNGMIYDSDGTAGTNGATLYKTEDGLKWDKRLTWTGSSHTASECAMLNGTVYNTGAGTICKAPFSAAPSGWTQAANWQRIVISAGDICGNWKNTGPTTFANQTSMTYSNSDVRNTTYYTYVRTINQNLVCDGVSVPYTQYGLWAAYVPQDRRYIGFYNLTSVSNAPTYRVEIGIY